MEEATKWKSEYETMKVEKARIEAKPSTATKQQPLAERALATVRELSPGSSVSYEEIRLKDFMRSHMADGNTTSHTSTSKTSRISKTNQASGSDSKSTGDMIFGDLFTYGPDAVKQRKDEEDRQVKRKEMVKARQRERRAKKKWCEVVSSEDEAPSPESLGLSAVSVT